MGTFINLGPERDRPTGGSESTIRGMVLGPVRDGIIVEEDPTAVAESLGYAISVLAAGEGALPEFTQVYKGGQRRPVYINPEKVRFIVPEEVRPAVEDAQAA